MDPIRHHFATHHGVITSAEAHALGMSTRTIQRRAETGRWTRIRVGVYRLSGAPRSWLGDARALAVGVDGLISHRAAARLWGIDGHDRSPLEVTVEVTRAPASIPGVRMHRSSQMGFADPAVRDGVPVTGLARTVLDLAAVSSRQRLHAAVDSVLRQRLLDWHDLVAVLVRHSRRGRDGCGKLRALLEERYGEERPPDSVFNRLVGELLEESCPSRPNYEFELFDGDHFVARVDLAFPSARVAVELDSRRYHDNELSFVADRRRANRIVNLGWRLLSFTWDDYRDTPEVLVQTVRDALRFSAASAPGGGGNPAENALWSGSV